MPDSALLPGNAVNLSLMLQFLGDLITARVREHLGDDPGALPQPTVLADGSSFAEFAKQHQPAYDEFTILALALAPHLRPAFLESCLGDALGRSGDFPEFGGRRDRDSRALIPTGETAAFLLADDDLDARFSVQALFSPDHWFATESLLSLEAAPSGAPHLAGRILMDRGWVERLTQGIETPPKFSASFPARLVAPLLNWDDLILEEASLSQLEDIRRWLRNRTTLARGAMPKGHLRKGYRALFYGPSGTGKTLAAGLIGKVAGVPVYRVDLSAVVSKYIGETEKNLSSLFETAQSRDWILFFDEADALFGKRTSVKDAHDRYANQEVSYLLQRVEDYDGLCILASNMRANVDDAFLGRFDSIVRFSVPGVAERVRLWDATLPVEPAVADRVAFTEVMARFELSGRAVVGAVQHATLAALDAGRQQLLYADAVEGVERELEKEGRVFQNLAADELAQEAPVTKL